MRVLLLVLLAAVCARAETCSGFESRLDALAQQVQAMIDIVEAMQPSGAAPCGGIVGTNVDSAQFLAAYSTKDGDGNEAYRFDSEWCCNQCRAYAGCTFWSLQFVGNYRCQLYGDLAVGSRDFPYYPGGFLFAQPFGVGPSVRRVSGALPPDQMWGSAGGSTQGRDDYMEDTDPGTGKTYQLMNPLPAGALAEGYEMCDSLGPFKPAWLAPPAVDNGNALTMWVPHPLECCSLCARGLDVHGNALWAPCVLWAYNYNSAQRQCQVRDAGYLGLSGNPQGNAADLEAYQNGAVCAQYDTVGNPRTRPDGSPCSGTFPATRWSSGLPSASDLVALEARESAP